MPGPTPEVIAGVIEDADRVERLPRRELNLDKDRNGVVVVIDLARIAAREKRAFIVQR
jgi:hypothetical protein